MMYYRNVLIKDKHIK